MAGFMGRNPYAGNYPASYAPTMNGYQMPGYGWPGMQQTPQQTAGNPQMTRPMVHADIMQVEDEAEMDRQPVDAGTSQMMITKDEMVIGVKSVLANGESTMDIYRKQPRVQKPAEPEYITREEFEQRMAEMIRAEREKERTPLRVLKPETAEEMETEYEAPRPVQRTRNTSGGKRG
jgi:hypothetical protein